MTAPLWLVRLAWVGTGLFTIIILWAFLTPVAQLPRGLRLSDYLWHVIIFAVLIIPLCSVLPNQRPKIAGAALVFGIVIELVQPHFGRGFEIHDLVSNIAGVGIGWYLSQHISGFLIR